jgi:hypothetical protein
VPVVLLLLAAILTVAGWRALATRRATRSARPGYRFVAPDDDPDFIHELWRRTRRADDEQT